MLLSYVVFMFFCLSDVITSFKSLRAGSQVFALRMLFFCVNLHTMWSGKSLQLLCNLPLYVVLVCHQYDVCKKNMLAVCMFVGMVA